MVVRTLAVALVAIAVIGTVSCQVGARAGGRCSTTSWGDDGTYLLRCQKGRWVRAASKSAVAALYVKLLRARAAATTTTTTTTTIPAAAPIAFYTPTGTTAEGPDVSKYQHPGGAPIDWGAVRAAGFQFAFIKATEGTTSDLNNPYFTTDWSAVGGVGLLRGAYHFARPALPLSTAQLQARNFVAVTGSMQGAADLPPVLDVEVSGGLGQSDLIAWIQTWLTEVENLTGRRPMIYTGLNFWNGATGGSSAVSNYRLWFARYVTGNSPGTLPTGFGSATFWQYTSTARIAGISANVDVSRYCCPGANLTALAGGSNNPAAGSPFGSVDLTAGRPDGKVDVAGWSIDPDQVAPIETHVYVDGANGTNLGPTNTNRADIATQFPQFGPLHGFTGSVSGLTPGPHNVCVYAINVGYGQNVLLQCKDVVVPGGSPGGRLDPPQAQSDGTVTAAGFAVDPDVTTPVTVRLALDGGPPDAVVASTDRSDVSASYPGYGTAHGFTWSASGLDPGTHSLCATAVNVGVGSDTSLGCRSFTV